ncbi:SDR family NAD(P)-dependent oxidoreductase [Reyranella sp.]|uniref:SDR family NAD(P)-dependent oxidoreductase n=1 Tax=Reyranella sp. TaxID=1929291 RepID=UPI003783D43B
MTNRLADKVALVTGAGSVGPGWGNGRAAAVLFAREGARVVVVDRDRAAATETARLIDEAKGESLIIEADATDLASVTAMADTALKRFGRIDVLLNNVGGSITGGPVEMSVEDFRRQLDLNLTSVFITCKVVLPTMVGEGGGAIVNVGSIGGLRHLGHDHVGYSAGKSALVQFTRQIAVRYAPDNIRCNTVIPGMIDTPLLEHRVSRQKGRADLATLRAEARTRVPLGRRGDAWDVAYAALFLASDEAKYITGTEILVDGGLMARSA